VLALPRTMVRLRLACLWPILIGLETLLILIHNDHWLEPTKASKLRRIDVYELVACSIPVVASNDLIRSWVEKLVAEIEGGYDAVANVVTSQKSGPPMDEHRRV
jgi:farnesyl-diphosphate farnesyltransferase